MNRETVNTLKILPNLCEGEPSAITINVLMSEKLMWLLKKEQAYRTITKHQLKENLLSQLTLIL